MRMKYVSTLSRERTPRARSHDPKVQPDWAVGWTGDNVYLYKCIFMIARGFGIDVYITNMVKISILPLIDSVNEELNANDKVQCFWEVLVVNHWLVKEDNWWIDDGNSLSFAVDWL